MLRPPCLFLIVVVVALVVVVGGGKEKAELKRTEKYFLFKVRV